MTLQIRQKTLIIGAYSADTTGTVNNTMVITHLKWLLSCYKLWMYFRLFHQAHYFAVYHQQLQVPPSMGHESNAQVG